MFANTTFEKSRLRRILALRSTILNNYFGTQLLIFTKPFSETIQHIVYLSFKASLTMNLINLTRRKIFLCLVLNVSGWLNLVQELLFQDFERIKLFFCLSSSTVNGKRPMRPKKILKGFKYSLILWRICLSWMISNSRLIFIRF